MQNTSADAHFSRSLETSEFVLPLIEGAVTAACQALPSFKAQCDVFLGRRRNAVVNGRPMLRPYLARVLYELGGGKNWHDMAPAFAAVELHNISTYQTNLSFDGKVDWPHAHTTPHNQVMAAMVSISAAHCLLNQLRGRGATSEAIGSACQRLHQANGAVYLGQYLDLNALDAQSVGDLQAWTDGEYLPRYLQRCRLMGGGTFTSVLIGYELSPAEGDPVIGDALESYLIRLGMGTQMTNDLGDYYLDGSRPYSASFMDLRRGRLTLPTYRMLRAGFGPALEIWRGTGHASGASLRKCVEWLRQSGVYGEARELLEREVWSGISAALRGLETVGIASDVLSPLTFARPFLFNTKYLKYLKPV